MGVVVILWVGVGVIVLVRKGVCGWDSLDCCHKACVCLCVKGKGRGEGCVWMCVCECDYVGVRVIVWVGVGVIAWVRKGVGWWDSLDCCRKVCVYIWGEGGMEWGREECVCVCVWCDCGCWCDCGGGCGCDCMVEKGSVWVGQP